MLYIEVKTKWNLKGTVVLFGESFRLGGQGSRNIGLEGSDSYKDQVEATISHLDFLSFLKTQGIDAKLVVNTYQTPYDEEIKRLYGAEIFNSNPERMGLQNIFNQSCELVKDLAKDFVFFIRVDLILKPKFKKVFKPCDQIVWPFVCRWAEHRTGHNFPRVADTMIFVPKTKMEFVERKDIFVNHDGWLHLRQFLKRGDQGLFINTLHDSDSEKDWNPIYKIAGRPENNFWSSPQFTVDKELNFFIEKEGELVIVDKIDQSKKPWTPFCKRLERKYGLRRRL